MTVARIDLHTHTLHSDGTFSPTELVDLAVQEGLVAVAVTDHDTTIGLEETLDAGKARGIEIITGCEISTNLDGRSVHVLAHGFEPGAPRLEALLRQVRDARDERNAKMLERLVALGLPLTYEEVAAHATGPIVARPHFARAMVDRGYVPDPRAAFRRYLQDGGPAWVVADRTSPEAAVRTIRDAGGVATIAHPHQIGIGNRTVWEGILERLEGAGLVGLEVDHPGHRPEHRAFFGSLVEAFDLVRTGGSDFHGAVKPRIALGRGDGTIDVPYATWERLRERRREPITG